MATQFPPRKAPRAHALPLAHVTLTIYRGRIDRAKLEGKVTGDRVRQ
jgi:hypothetical protein